MHKYVPDARSALKRVRYHRDREATSQRVEKIRSQRISLSLSLSLSLLSVSFCAEKQRRHSADTKEFRAGSATQFLARDWWQTM